MPAKKAAKKSAKRPTAKQKSSAGAKKATAKSKPPARAKKATVKSKPPARAKKATVKSKPLASAKKAAKAARKPASATGKSKKVATAKKAASRPRIAPIPKEVPILETKELGFVDVGRFETEIYEPDPEVRQEFAEAAGLGDSTMSHLLENLSESMPEPSPALSGGDIDAAWNRADDASGEAAVGGSNPTPDQDIVEKLGEAVGVSYQDDEPLDPTNKVSKRDEHRWELEPQSSEDFDERSNQKSEQ
jgi:Family of unknown function (DUF6335)